MSSLNQKSSASDSKSKRLDRLWPVCHAVHRALLHSCGDLGLGVGRPRDDSSVRHGQVSSHDEKFIAASVVVSDPLADALGLTQLAELRLGW
jgi:hypothetical protein